MTLTSRVGPVPSLCPCLTGLGSWVRAHHSGPALMSTDHVEIKRSQTVLMPGTPHAPPPVSGEGKHLTGSLAPPHFLACLCPSPATSMLSVANGHFSAPVIHNIPAASGPVTFLLLGPCDRPHTFLRPGSLPWSRAPGSGPALLCCMTPPGGEGNCPASLSSPSSVARKIANSCCDHGLPRPQGPGGKLAKGNLERKLLITYLPQAASKETSPHKSFHKHLAGSQESVHGSHPAIRRLLTSKLRPGSSGLCQIPLPEIGRASCRERV